MFPVEEHQVAKDAKMLEHAHDHAPGADARFNGPDGITVSPTGDVVVADRLNNALRLVSNARLVQGAVTSRPAGATSQLRSIGLGATRSTTSLGAHVPRPRKSCVVGAPGAASRHL